MTLSNKTLRKLNWLIIFCVLHAGIIAALIIVNRLFALYCNEYYLRILLTLGINVILAVSLNLISAQTGQFSLGHAGFMAIGAYGSAAFTFYAGPGCIEFITKEIHLLKGMSVTIVFIVAIGISGLLAAFAGFLVGLPVLRLRGDYLAIATLGFGEIIRNLILNMDALGGARGLPDIPQYSNLFWIGLWTYITIVIIRNIVCSIKGRAFLAIREDEIAAESIGISTTKYKVGAFVIGAFFAGVAGCLFAHLDGYLNTDSFNFIRSIEIVVMVVLGGMSSISGCVASAAILTILPEALRGLSEYRMVIYSLILILMMIGRAKIKFRK